MTDVPEGFEPIGGEGAFVQHVGPLLGRDGVGLLVLGHARHLLTAPKRSPVQDHKHD